MISYNKFSELFKAIKSIYPVATMSYTMNKKAVIFVGSYSVDVTEYGDYDFLSATRNVFNVLKEKGLTDELAQQYYEESVQAMEQAWKNRNNVMSPAYSINGSAN